MQNWRLSERGDHAMGIAGDGPGQQTMFNNAEYVGTEATLKKRQPQCLFQLAKMVSRGGVLFGGGREFSHFVVPATSVPEGYFPRGEWH